MRAVRRLLLFGLCIVGPVAAAPIIFQAAEGAGVYSIQADGSALTLLAPDAITPALSPDGRRLLFADREGIWQSAVDGSGRELLVPGDRLIYPSWSRDGTRIVFLSRGRITLADADGANQRIVTIGLSPRWLSSDDGALRFTASRRTDHSALWMARASTGDTVLVRDDAYVPTVTYPMSPDGTRIVIRANGPASGLTLRVLDLLSRQEAQIGPTGPRSPRSAAWSADGSLIAHDVFRGRDGLWLSPPDGAAGTMIVPGEVKVAPTVPSWSPDGTMIAFHMMNFDGGPSRIHVVNVDGTGLRRLADGRNALWSAMPVTAPASAEQDTIETLGWASVKAGVRAAIRSASGRSR